MNTSQSWNALFTRPNCEKKVTALLEKKGIVCYCPQNHSVVKGYQEDKMVVTPLFASMVFFQPSASTQLSSVRQLSDVLNLVYWQQQPAAFPAGEIAALQSFLEAHETVQVMKRDVQPVYNMDAQHATGTNYLSKDNIYNIDLPTIGYTLAAKAELVTSVKLVRKTAPVYRAADSLAFILGFKVNGSKFE